MNATSKSETKFEDEFDLIEFAKSIKHKRRFIAIVSSCCLFIGIVFILISKDTYSVSSKVLITKSDQSDNLNSKISGLAGLAGINISSNNSSSLSSNLYPEIVQSLPFRMDLIQQNIGYKRIDNTISLKQFFGEIAQPPISYTIKKYTVGLPKLLSGKRDKTNTETRIVDGIYQLSATDKYAISRLIENVEIEVDDETGVITITTETNDAITSSQLNTLVARKLEEFTIKFKIDKSKRNLDFIEASYLEAKEIYEDAQNKLALFMDRNQNVTTSAGRIEMQRLENSYSLAFNIFNSLSSQYEQAKISLNDETPVFAVLEPVSIPTSTSNTSPTVIIIVSIVLGVFISIGYLFLMEIVTHLGRL